MVKSLATGRQVGTPRQEASRGRLRQLDSIRGIASLFVVFNHYILLVPKQLLPPPSLDQLLTLAVWLSPLTWLRFTPARLLVDGEAAVDLFFVLSGFVLALPLTRHAQPPFLAFLVKRFCRVYLPFAGVILIVAAAYEIIPTAPSPAVSSWLNGLLLPRGSYSVTAHLLMGGREADMRLDPVMWTLVHEMRVSVIFPVIFLAIRRIGAAQTVGACLVISVLASFGMSDSISGDWQATVHFLWMFAAGSALSYHRDGIMRFMRQRSRTTILCLWVLTLMLLIVPFNRVWADFLIGCGAALLICLCLNRTQLTDVLVVPDPPSHSGFRHDRRIHGLGVVAGFRTDPGPRGSHTPVAGTARAPDRHPDRPHDRNDPTTDMSAAFPCPLSRR
jgi:peptidoglycan/LPS O-acetylase OafA/YrhL